MKMQVTTSDNKPLDLDLQSGGHNQIDIDGVELARFMSGGIQVEIRDTGSRMEVWFKGQCVWPPKVADGRGPVPHDSSGGLPWHRR